MSLRSFALPAFWKCYDALPDNTKALADAKYALFEQDPFHQGLAADSQRSRSFGDGQIQGFQGAGISPEMAVRLSIAFNNSAESWLNQQLQYDLWQAERNRKRLHVTRLTAA